MHSKTRVFPLEIYTFSVDKWNSFPIKPLQSPVFISVFCTSNFFRSTFGFLFFGPTKRGRNEATKKQGTSCSCHWGDGAPRWVVGWRQLTDTTKRPGIGSPPLGAAASNQGQEVGSRHPAPPGSGELRDLWVPKRSQNRTCSRWWFRWFLISMVRKQRCLFLMMSPRVESSPVKSTSPTPHPKSKIFNSKICREANVARSIFK